MKNFIIIQKPHSFTPLTITAFYFRLNTIFILISFILKWLSDASGISYESRKCREVTFCSRHWLFFWIKWYVKNYMNKKWPTIAGKRISSRKTHLESTSNLIYFFTFFILNFFMRHFIPSRPFFMSSHSCLKKNYSTT
jgi:hypothetical protein